MDQSKVSSGVRAAKTLSSKSEIARAGSGAVVSKTDRMDALVTRILKNFILCPRGSYLNAGCSARLMGKLLWDLLSRKMKHRVENLGDPTE